MNWRQLVETDNADELKNLKMFLFQENMRLEMEKRHIEEDRQQLESQQAEFREERSSLRQELNELNRKTVQEREKLREDNLFFEKKMNILQEGFRNLEEDRQKLERERAQFENRRKHAKPVNHRYTADDYDEIAAFLFSSVETQIGLRKRYKDLIKIFHPDNTFGDEAFVQAINREFERRKENFA